MVRVEVLGNAPQYREVVTADTTAELEAYTPGTELASGVALDTGLPQTWTRGLGWKAPSGGGTSVTLTVVLSDVVSNRLTATWDNPGNASLFQVFLRDGGVSTYIEPETSDLSVEIPLPVSQVDRTVSVEVYSLDGCGTASAVVPASTVLPNVPFRLIGENMEYTTPAPAAEATLYTYASKLRNDEPFPMSHVSTLLSSIADPPQPLLAIGYKSGSWVTDTAVPVPPSGGGIIPGDTRPTPMMVFSDLKALPGGVAPGGTMWYETCADPGVGYANSAYRSISAGNSITNLMTHPSGEWYEDRRTAGNIVGTDATGGTAIGPAGSHLLIRYGATNGIDASYHNVACFGDSTFAQVRAPVATARSREGIFYQANHALIAAGRKLRFASFGEGSSKFTCIQHRLERLAPLLNQYCQSVLWQLPTANQPFTSVGQYEALWQTFLTISATIRSETGMLVHAAISTPPASFSQTQVNLDGYAYIAARIAESGGINLAPVLGGTNMSVNNSSDGAHLTEAGVNVAYPELVTQALALYGGLNVDV